MKNKVAALRIDELMQSMPKLKIGQENLKKLQDV
jgi:hypothetical protein